MTNEKLIAFYSLKEAHYDKSDEFIKKYRQDRGGYISKAKKMGKVINKTQAEPDQKWHLLVSCFGNESKEKMMEEANCYNRFRCPELLLWMAEAAGCDIKEAAIVAEQWCEKGDRLKAVKAIRELIPWTDIEKQIISEI